MTIIVQQYQDFRRASRAVGNKVRKKALNRQILDQAGNLLRVAHGNVLVFDDPSEANVMLDFALNDCRRNGKNAYETYRDTVGWEDETEKAVLDAFLSSYTSLFRITAVEPGEAALLLRDLLNQGDALILIDLGLGRTALPGLLMFARLVPFADGLNMTSGVGFLYPGDLETDLLCQYKKLARKVKTDSDSARRYVAFFELHKQYGMPVKYELPP